METLHTRQKILQQQQPSNSSGSDNASNFLDRVKVFLNGLKENNKNEAENKIIMYLCKCQIADLNEGDVRNIQI